MTISASVIAHSRPVWAADAQHDIFTFVLQYPRFIHSEFMTHRMFSRNASSSRAIPVDRLLERTRDNPAVPITWGSNKPGMQAGEEIEDPTAARDIWLWGAGCAYGIAEQLRDRKVHKQIVNRVLEPYSYITTIVTATEWDNFFGLRLHASAQPEIHALAQSMFDAKQESEPRILKPGEWHTPFALKGVEDVLTTSVAGCARVSYTTHDSKIRTAENDANLYTQLLTSGHMSPFEHQATPMAYPMANRKLDEHWPWGVTHLDRSGYLWSGNFRGWVQFRQVV